MCAADTFVAPFIRSYERYKSQLRNEENRSQNPGIH